MSFQEQPTGAITGLPPEIAFLLAVGVEGRLLARAAEMARQSATDAATALLRSGLMDEASYYRALAHALGVPFLDGPIPFGAGLRHPDCLVAGRAPLAPGAGAEAVIAPEGAAVADLLAGRIPVRGLALTSPTRLREAVFAAMPEVVAAEALGRRPDPAAPGPALLVLALSLSALASLHAAAPPLPALAVTLGLQVVILALTAIRLAAPTIAPPRVEAPPLPDAALPVYTILVPLYREGRMVPRLVTALAALDYPVAKLDIKFLIEADDGETARALAEVPFPARFEILTVPPGLPRTKPRALNVALPLARGSLLVVYDAEDVPEPDQLRRAAAILAAEPPSTACLQGRLVIDDHGDGLLPKLFAAEYAGLFDVVNPALCALDLPVPLGGTTMHLRTRVLRDLGGWDPHCVTEDADLGLRLALAGYQVGDLPSATYEETARGGRRWLAQRTRWHKGFMQVSLAHGARPRTVLARLGPLGAFGALALVPGTVASALAYPVCLTLFAWDVISGRIAPAPFLLDNLVAGLALTLFVAGLAAIMAPAALGCRRRGWGDLWWAVSLLPVYFLFVSLAAWAALAELVRAPHRWNKTEHGLARSSRSGMLRMTHPQRNGRSAR